MSEFDTLPKTPNLNLNKPAYDNVADINALNENADILDTAITGINTNLTNHFSDLQAHSNIFANVEFYVATTGSDSNDGAEGTPFKTIQKAVDSIPIGSKYAKINIANGTYNENVINHNGNGMQIELYGNTNTSVKTISLYGKCVVRIQNISLNATTSDANCLVLSGVYAIIDSCTFNGVTTGKGVYLYGSTGMIRNCTFNNCQRGIYAVYGAEISATGNSYSDNIIDIYANGGIIHTDDVATTSSENGGAVINKLMGKSLTTGVADSTTDATDSSKKLATTEFLKKSYLNLAGGTLTGDLGLNLSDGKLTGGILVSENHADSEVIFINGNTYLALRNEKDTREGTANTFSLVNKINGIEHIFESRNNGTLLWRNMLMEVVNSKGDDWIRYEGGLQICWTVLQWTSNYSWTFPVVFSSEPIIQVTPVSAGVTPYVESPSGSGTYCNIKANSPSYFKVLAIGGWK